MSGDAKTVIDETAAKIPHPFKKKQKFASRTEAFKVQKECPICGMRYKHLPMAFIADGKNPVERECRIRKHLVDHVATSFMG